MESNSAAAAVAVATRWRRHNSWLIFIFPPLVTVSPIILYIYTHIYTIYYALMVSYRIIIVLLCCKTVPRSLTSLPRFLLGWARNLLPYAAICQSATDIAQHCGTFHPPPPPPPNWLRNLTVMLTDSRLFTNNPTCVLIYRNIYCNLTFYCVFYVYRWIF